MDATVLKDVLHAVAQALTYPVILLLLLAIGYAVFSIGSVLLEFFVERRHFKVALPQLLRALEEAPVEEMPSVIDTSGMLLRQKAALVTIFVNRDLPEEGLWALAKKLLVEETAHYQRITGRNDMAAKVSPMLGLMGTLIPLGPGIVALGQGDTATLAGSLLIAFDTTVAGLVTAAVCLVISKVRKGWYAQYLSSLEAAVTTILEKIDLIRTCPGAWSQTAPSGDGGSFGDGARAAGEARTQPEGPGGIPVVAYCQSQVEEGSYA